MHARASMEPPDFPSFPRCWRTLGHRASDSRILLVLLAGLMFLAVSACNNDAESDAEPEEAPDLRSTVATVVLETTDFEDRIELIGFIEPGRTGMVSSELPGRITRLSVEVGDTVTRGQLVAQVETPQQDVQRAQLDVQLAQVEREIERMEQLLERGLGTSMQLDQLRSQRDGLRESIRQITTAQRQARSTAPISGVVVERMAEPGEFANPGVPLLRILDMSTVKVMVGVPESDLRYLRQDQSVRVFVDALGTDREGVVRRIGQEIDGRNRSFPVEIELENEDGSLRSGMRVRMQWARTTRPQVVIAPRDALVQTYGGMEAVVIEDQVARQRTVRPGPTLGRFVVIEEGLEAGEALVVVGQRSVVDGEQVEVTRQESCCTEQVEAFMRERFGAR